MPDRFDDPIEGMRTKLSSLLSPSARSGGKDPTDPRRDLERRETVLRRIHRAISDKEAPLEEKTDRLLRIGRETLATDAGALSYVDGGSYRFEVVHDPVGGTEAGDVVPLETTTCERTVSTKETIVLADVPSEAPELADRGDFAERQVLCYIGTPVVVDGEVYGTFCFYDYEPRSVPFSEWEITLVDLMGDWISYEKERELRETALRKQRNRLDDFASIVAHDLRNPLAAAEAQLQLARERRDDGSEHLAEVGAALDRMDELIDDVLTLARVGNRELATAPVDVETIAEDAWTTAGDEDASLTVDDLPPIVADESRVRQLLENVFRNAVEHGARRASARDARGDGVERSSTGSQNGNRSDDSVEHGSTSSRAEPDDAVEHGSTSRQPTADDAVEGGSAERNADRGDDPETERGPETEGGPESEDVQPTVAVRVGSLDDRDGFFVEDDGVGVPPAERERVFEGSYSVRGGGTGFGLNIVQEIADAHGWSIDLTESEDGGARFEFEDVEFADEG